MSGGFYPNQAVGVEIEAWKKFTIGLIGILRIKFCAERRYQTKGQFSAGNWDITLA
jgi:hypothetical protein